MENELKEMEDNSNVIVKKPYTDKLNSVFDEEKKQIQERPNDKNIDESSFNSFKEKDIEQVERKRNIILEMISNKKKYDEEIKNLQISPIYQKYLQKISLTTSFDVVEQELRKENNFYGVSNINQLTSKGHKLLIEKTEQEEIKNRQNTKIEINNLLLQNNTNDASEEVVKYILLTNKIYTIRNDNSQEVWIYKDGIYQPQGITYIEEICREFFGVRYTGQLKNKVLDKIKADTYIDSEHFFINENIDKICLLNGILDITTKILEPFSDRYRFFNKIPVKFDETKQCKNIKQFFLDVLKNQDDLPLIQELFGFLLLREYRYEKSFMFIGNGRNGKSKTLDLMKRFIGVDNCSNIPLSRLEEDLFSMSELHNKLANLSGDISKSSLKNTGNFKSLTGRDLISAPRKFLTNISFENYAKMIFATNDLPITYDLTVAFFNRWILLEFPYTFLKQEEINILEDKTNIKLADPNIIDKISSPEEMSGLLNWALDGLKRLSNNRDFSYSHSTNDVKTIWLRKSSSLNAFLMDCIDEDYDSFIIKQEFKTSYIKYCREHKLKIYGDKFISDALSLQFGASSDRLYDETRKMIWRGIKFSSANVSKETKGFSTLGRISNSAIAEKTLGNLGFLGFNVKSQIILFCKTEISKQDLIERFPENIRDEVEKTIIDLLNKGELFEPQSGYLKVLE